MVSRGPQMAWPHRPAAPAQVPQALSLAQSSCPKCYLPVVPANRTNIHIPLVVVTSYTLLMRNNQPAGLRTGGGTQIPVLRWRRGTRPGRCTGPLCLGLSLPKALTAGRLEQSTTPALSPQPFLFQGTGPSLGCGQEGSQSLTHLSLEMWSLWRGLRTERAGKPLPQPCTPSAALWGKLEPCWASHLTALLLSPACCLPGPPSPLEAPEPSSQLISLSRGVIGPTGKQACRGLLTHTR